MKWLVGVAISIIVMTTYGCTSYGSARRVLENAGISEIRITGYAYFMCSGEDTFATAFEGIENGQPVSGAVCEGWFKGATIRYN